MHAIDLSPITNAVVTVAATALISAGYWLVARAARWLGARGDNEIVLSIDNALAQAIQAGAASASGLIAEKGWDHPAVKSAILAFAAPYAINRFPGVLRHLGVDPKDPVATRDKVMGELDRVFPTAIAPIANSPVTPPIGIPAVPSGPETTTKTLNDEELAALARQRAAEAAPAQS